MGSIKKIAAALFAAFCAAGLLACNHAGGALSGSETIGSWKLTLVDARIATDLKAEQSTVQYSGETVVSAIKETPDEGMVFVLVQLKIEKEQSGGAVFSWDRLSIQDADENRYLRMENDSFLQNYGFTRQKSTDLTLGTNEGYVCFELPEAAANGKLTLLYETDDASCSIPLN